MAINRFETVLPGAGMVDCYYKYDNNDNVYSVGVRIDGWPEYVEFDHDLYMCLLDKAVQHHKQVMDARKYKAGHTDSNGVLS